jgi:excisionase family DNA binding protein
MNEQRLTLSEAAAALGVHRNTIRNWIKAGKLPSASKTRDGDGVEQWTIDEDEILAMRRGRPQSRTSSTESTSETVWVIHDLAIRLADAEARAAAAEAKLEALTRQTGESEGSKLSEEAR